MGILLSAILVPHLIRIAVVDTGINRLPTISFCPYGHRSFVDRRPFTDAYFDLHGTRVAKLISKQRGVCVISIKAFNGEEAGFTALFKALEYLQSIPVDRVNLSYGGKGYVKREAMLIKALLKKHVKIFAAAGNNAMKLGPNRCNYYPACYDPRIIVVGSIHPASNFGPAVDVVVPKKIATSFATAIVSRTP